MDRTWRTPVLHHVLGWSHSLRPATPLRHPQNRKQRMAATNPMTRARVRDLLLATIATISSPGLEPCAPAASSTRPCACLRRSWGRLSNPHDFDSVRCPAGVGGDMVGRCEYELRSRRHLHELAQDRHGHKPHDARLRARDRPGPMVSYSACSIRACCSGARPWWCGIDQCLEAPSPSPYHSVNDLDPGLPMI